MDNKQFFSSADEINRKILEKLKTVKLELDKLFSTHQRLSDIREGLILRNGIYLPLKQHRIIYDGYEVQFVDVFNDFFSKMLDEKDCLFREFAIRTISEMGLKDSQILFSPTLTDGEKKRFKTISMLADYAFLGIQHPERKYEYKKLYYDEKNNLTEKQQLVFLEMSRCLDAKNYDLHTKLVKRIRKLVESTKNDLYKKTKTHKLFRKRNIEGAFSAFSHLIHGNIILLTDFLSKERPKYRNRLRATWALLLSGINTLIQVRDFLETKKVKLDIDSLLDEFEVVSKEMATNWRLLEKEYINRRA